MKQKKQGKKKGLIWKILTPVFAVLLVVCIVAIPITQGYSDIISNALHAKTQKVEADPDAKIYYWTAWEDQQALVDHEYELSAAGSRARARPCSSTAMIPCPCPRAPNSLPFPSPVST